MSKTSPNITVPITYRMEWPDGFGARGWKLDTTLDEPSVIAATAETGGNIPTSVLIHDLLDHHLSGFAVGGHRNEARALIQLASRTGADPGVDYAQIVDEDLMARGHCSGEPLLDFLPADVLAHAPAGIDDGRAVMSTLARRWGREALRARLIRHFRELGEAAQDTVEARWRTLGLDYGLREAIGLALQAVLHPADNQVYVEGWHHAHGRFVVGNEICALELDRPWPLTWRQRVHAPPHPAPATAIPTGRSHGQRVSRPVADGAPGTTSGARTDPV